MVDDQIHRYLGIYFLRVSAQGRHRGPHGREVNDAGNPGKVLQEDTGRFEGHLDLAGSLRVIGEKSLHIPKSHFPPVFRPQNGLEQYPYRIGKTGYAGIFLGELRQAEIRVFAGRDLQFFQTAEGIGGTGFFHVRGLQGEFESQHYRRHHPLSRTPQVHVRTASAGRARR